MLLSEYRVAITFEITEHVEQRICIRFCKNFVLNLNILPQKLLRWAGSHSYGQPVIGSFITTTHHSCITSRTEFLAKHQITQVTQPPYSPDWVPCNFQLFPKLKSPLKGKRFLTVNEIQENVMGQLMAIGTPGWGPKVPTLKGTEASLSYVQYFLYLVSA